MTKDLAIGIMSGTSGDGVSVVLAWFRERSFQLIDYKTFPYPEKIAQKIQAPLSLKVSEVSQLNFQLGEFFSRCVLEILRRNKISATRVDVIGSPGQTIFHSPHPNPLPLGEGKRGRVASTFQIGESSVLAEKTGITVVSDFRTRDVAVGGQGAPLMPFFDHYFFGNGQVRALQNIGGIANVTVVGKKVKEPIAFDTGPGNCLIDWAMRQISHDRISFDKDGKMARKGRVRMNFINQMANHPYFRKSPPKSTGRELFNEHFLPPELKNLLKRNPEDALATLTYFTAFTIAQSYKRFIFPKHKLNEVIVSGGGVFNKTLMTYLQHLFQKIGDSPHSGTVPVCSVQKFGIHPQAKEPLAFAFFALRAIQGKTNHLPSGTGAKKAVILGKITPGKNYRGLS